MLAFSDFDLIFNSGPHFHAFNQDMQSNLHSKGEISIFGCCCHTISWEEVQIGNFHISSFSCLVLPTIKHPQSWPDYKMRRMRICTFTISSFSLHFLFIFSAFSRSPAARLPQLCNPVAKDFFYNCFLDDCWLQGNDESISKKWGEGMSQRTNLPIKHCPRAVVSLSFVFSLSLCFRFSNHVPWLTRGSFLVFFFYLSI